MRILHVYKDYHPILGGIENHVRTLAELQASAGHDVTVLVTNPGGQPPRQQLNGVTIIRAPRLATIASTPLSPTFPLQLHRLRPAITHLHFPYPVGELSQWLAGRGRPYVITYHSDVVRQQRVLRLYRPVLQRVLRGAARILPTSEQYAATSPFLRPLAARCTVVPLSVDPARFAGAAPLLPRAAVPTLLFVGRHRYYKGLDDLLRALPGLEARLIAGGDGPMRPAWEKLAAELALGDQVQFLGDVSDGDLPGLYASADIFVLPANSHAEAFGKVLLEAMASGLPCITTEVGTGTSSVVQDGETGLVVAPRDPPALRAALQRLLAAPSLRHQMGAAGRARVISAFTPQQLLQRVHAVYEEVVLSGSQEAG
jgi:glycosyltransferase involved in cell wall biosynthesis